MTSSLTAEQLAALRAENEYGRGTYYGVPAGVRVTAAFLARSTSDASPPTLQSPYTGELGTGVVLP